MSTWRRNAAVAAAAVGVIVAGTLVLTAVRQRPLTYDEQPIVIEGEIFHTGDHLGVPVDLAVTGDLVLAIDRHGDKNLHAIDARDGRLVASVGEPGEGPAEFMAPATLTRDREGRVWILDTTTQRMTRLDLTRLDDGTAWADSSFQLHGALVTDLSWTARRGLIAGGTFRDGRFGLLNGEGVLTDEVGSFPEAGRDYPAVLRQQAFLSRLAARPDGRAFAVAARYAGRIDLIDDRGVSRGQVTAPYPFDPDFTVTRRGDFPVASFPPESVTGYIDAAASERFVFGLFSGRTEKAFPGRDNYARDIHVFDWDGVLVEVLRTDRDVFAIEVDAVRGRLLAIVHDPVPAIVAYPLPVADGTARLVSGGRPEMRPSDD